MVIDPIGLVPVYVGLTAHYNPKIKKNIALRAVIIGGLVLTVFAFLGEFILTSLHISESAFRIAGSLLLLLTAVDMVTAHHLGFGLGEGDDPDGREKGHSIAVFPLAIPLISGPGSLVSIVLTMNNTENTISHLATIFVALALILALTYVCLRYASWVTKILGKTGANVLTRVFGIILAALAIQGILGGINILLYTPIFKL